MQRLLIRIACLTAVLVLSGAGFSRTSDAAPFTRQVSYYWYTWPDDTYNDYNTVSAEEYEMWIYYDAPVNEDPAGGELVERGFTNNVYPHEFPPTQFLYVHWPEGSVKGRLRR